MKALVAGASGLTGSFLLEELHHSNRYSSIVSLVRKPSGKILSSVTEIVVDFNHPSSWYEYMNVDHVFCCLGTTIKKAGSKDAFIKVDLEIPLSLATVAQEQGTTHFLVISAMGADSKSVFFYNQVKGKLEDALNKIPFEYVSVLRPSLLTGPRKEKRIGEKIGKVLSSIIDPLLFGSWKAYRSIKAKDVAKAMASLALRTDKGFKVYNSYQLQEIANSTK
jgi:uncharacterized protein YbjT (DUF2867 family)